MASSEKKAMGNEFNIFIANSIYPEAASVFTTSVKSLKELKEDSLIVLDTNALLVPYNIGRDSLNQIRETYKKLVTAERLIIPGQVAREFAKNRANKLTTLFQQFNRKANISNLQKGKYPLLESLDEYQKLVKLEQEIDEKLREYRKTIQNVLDHIRQWTWNDPVSLLYADLFKDKMIFDPPIKEDEFRDDLRKRQLHRIPPGYKDAGKEDEGIGDLLIWHTILEIGKIHKKDVLFVSGEEKPDWWYKSENQALYPRYELVDEFRRASDGRSFQITQFSTFLNLFGASEETVEEIRKQEVQERFTLERVDSVEASGNLVLQENSARKAVFRWLKQRFPAPIIADSLDLPFDFIIKDTEEIIAVKVKYYHRVLKVPLSNIQRTASELVSLKRPEIIQLIFVVVTPDNESAARIASVIRRDEVSYPVGIETVIGYLDQIGNFEECASIMSL